MIFSTACSRPHVVLLFLFLAIPTFAVSQEVLFLDTYEDPEPGTGFTTPVFTTEPLLAGQRYRVTLEGAISLASESDWTTGGSPCGTLEPSTTFPSPAGAMDGPVGMDPLYFFAVPFDFCGGIPSLPALVPSTTFSLDGGATFGLPDLPAPPPYSPSHRYSFPVVGQGQLAAFRYGDDFLPNNYGQFRITLTPIAEPSPVPALPHVMLLLCLLLLLALGARTLGLGRSR